MENCIKYCCVFLKPNERISTTNLCHLILHSDPMPRTYNAFSLSQKVDLAVGSMTINSAREKVIDFTKPFRNLGISILFKVKLCTIPFLCPTQPILSSYSLNNSGASWMKILNANIKSVIPFRWTILCPNLKTIFPANYLLISSICPTGGQCTRHHPRS